MTVTFKGLDGIRSYKGKFVGTGEWHEVTQKDINLFADATRDWDWIHTDEEKAQKEGPFGCTIAHGYWTLGMLIPLLRDIYRFEDIGMGLNYGIERARFPAPVKVNSRIRLHMTMKDVIDVSGGVQVVMACEIENDQVEKPVLVADVLLRFYPSSQAKIS